MKIKAEKRLFWFLKDDTELDLDKTDVLNMYVQQVFSRGRTDDIKNLFKTINKNILAKSFESIKIFLPKEVKNFWDKEFKI